ncbi:MAG: PqqD family peptide modification chaperone [Thermoguttaceae bacterium]
MSQKVQLNSENKSDQQKARESSELIFNVKSPYDVMRSFHPQHLPPLPPPHLFGQSEIFKDTPSEDAVTALVGVESFFSAETAEIAQGAENLPFPNASDNGLYESEEIHLGVTDSFSAQNIPVTGLESVGLNFTPPNLSAIGLPPLGVDGAVSSHTRRVGGEFDPFAIPGIALPDSLGKEIKSYSSEAVPTADSEKPEKAAELQAEQDETCENIQKSEESEKSGQAITSQADSVATDAVSKSVRMQYEKLPYPFRNPNDDKSFLLMPMIDNLMILNQRCYNGKKDFHSEFNVLVAGGGTGDASTFLAVQTAWLPNAKVVYIDLSTESMKIAKERLHNQSVRLGQPNIEKMVEFHHGSLLDVGKMDLGKFDYINCSGVLHHLKDPSEGLAALKSVLKPDGAMGIMVYGKIGRTTIYQIQELMRIINKNEDDTDKKISNTNMLLKHLPFSNLHRKSGRWLANEGNPIEIYDLFLHSQDRAYTIDQLYDWIEGIGLNLQAFFSGLAAYLTPDIYPKVLPQKIRSRLKEMTPREQQAFSEMLFGHLNKFEFYVTPQQNGGIDLDDPNLIPSFSIIAKNQNLPNRLKTSTDAMVNFQAATHLEKMEIAVHVTILSQQVYNLIDESRTLGEIQDQLAARYPNIPRDTLNADVIRCLKKLMVFDMLHFRHKDCVCDLLNRGHF